jgi:hypothetical protein
MKHMVINARPSSCIESDQKGAPATSTVPNCDMFRLPSHLAGFHFSSSVNGAKFSSFDFACLPLTLSTMSIKLHDIQDAETLAAIPRTLKSLSILITTETDPSLTSDPELINHLPSNLTELLIDADTLCSAWYQWMHRMSRFTALETLDMFVWIAEDDQAYQESQPSLNFLASFPRTLKTLRIPLFGAAIQSEDIQALPRGLTKISFGQAGMSSGAASDDCFAHLPPSVVNLSFPSRIEGLTVDFFRKLPSTLVLFTVPDCIRDHLEIFYDREPEWQHKGKKYRY